MMVFKDFPLPYLNLNSEYATGGLDDVRFGPANYGVCGLRAVGRVGRSLGAGGCLGRPAIRPDFAQPMVSGE